MKPKSLFLFFCALLMTFMFLLSSCSDSNKDSDIIEETNNVVDDVTYDPEPDLPTPYELLQQSTGLQDFDDFIYDAEWEYTIQYQRNLVGNTYLTELFDFNIFEANGKLYLVNYSGVEILLEITEEQCNQILSNPDICAISFQIKTAHPSYNVEAELNYRYEDFYYYDEEGHEKSTKVINEGSLESYPTQSLDPLLHGVCLDVYLLK